MAFSPRTTRTRYKVKNKTARYVVSSSIEKHGHGHDLAVVNDVCLLMFSVTTLETHHYSAGQKITMKLMKKPRGSLQVLPASAAAAAADYTDTGVFPPSITGYYVTTVQCCCFHCDLSSSFSCHFS